MTLEEINARLAELLSRRARRAKLEAQKKDLYAQREERAEKERQTARILAKEQADVDKLEGKSLRGFFLELKGEKEERLAQERREALAARLQHDQAVADLEYLDKKILEVVGELDGLREDEGEIERLYREKEKLLVSMGGETARRLTQLEEELARTDAQLREVDEAAWAGRQARDALENVLVSLDSARSLGAWDMLGGGLMVTAMKHGRIDEARDGISWAQRALADFRAELADVEILDCPQVEIGSFATFADYFFDGLLVDWMVQSGIRQAQDNTGYALARVEEILGRLAATRSGLEGKRTGLEGERQELVCRL